MEDTRSADSQRFAMKRLSLGALRDWKTYELFEREARVLSGLRHPSIPKYVEHFELEMPAGEHSYYLVQELAPGASLADLVVRGWRCDEAEVRRIAVQLLGILRDLQALTPPVFHRDVKPHNILRADDGRLFLVDFGAVRDAYRTLTGGSTVVGTYGYMAPEQLRGVALPATDIYGVASTVLFLLTGVAPNDLPQRGLRADFRAHARCSPSLAAWLERALEPEPEKRFVDARAALDALRGVTKAAAPRSRARLAILLGVLVALLATAGGVAIQSLSEEHARASKTQSGTPGLPPRPASQRYEISAKSLPIDAHHSGAFSVDVSPDGRTIASGGGDGSLRLSDAKTGAAIATFAGSPGRVYTLHFTRDGRRLVSGAGRRVDVWDVATHTSTLGFDADAREVTSVRPSPDDRWIAGGGAADHAIKLWDLATGTLVRTLAPIPAGAPSSIAFSPDGKLVASSGEDPIVRVWSVDSGAIVGSFAGHTRMVDDLAFAPDGQTLYSTSDDHTLRAWRMDGHLLATLGDHGDEVWSVAASPRGDLVASGTKDGWIKLWDTARLQLKYQFEDLSHGTTRLAFTPDGTALAAAQLSGRVNVWALPAKTQARIPESPVVRDPPVVGASPTPAEACARAYALIDASNGRDLLGEAERLARGALAKSPGFPPANVALARIALGRGYVSGAKYRPEAIEAARGLVAQAEAAAPNLADVHIARAWLLRASKDGPGAAREATLAEAAGPTSAADTLLALENSKMEVPLSDVEHYALRGLGENPTRGEAWFLYRALGDAYQDAGDYEAADRAYRAQIDIDPDSVWAKGNYAHFLIGIGDYPGAQAAAKRALAQMNYGSAREALSTAQSEGGVLLLWDYARPDDARSQFEGALDANPSNRTAHYGLGAYWKLVGTRGGANVSALLKANVELAKGDGVATR